MIQLSTLHTANSFRAGELRYFVYLRRFQSSFLSSLLFLFFCLFVSFSFSFELRYHFTYALLLPFFVGLFTCFFRTPLFYLRPFPSFLSWFICLFLSNSVILLTPFSFLSLSVCFFRTPLFYLRHFRSSFLLSFHSSFVPFFLLIFETRSL